MSVPIISTDYSFLFNQHNLIIGDLEMIRAVNSLLFPDERAKDFDRYMARRIEAVRAAFANIDRLKSRASYGGKKGRAAKRRLRRMGIE